MSNHQSTCPRCQAALPEEAAACPACGAILAETAPAPSEPNEPIPESSQAAVDDVENKRCPVIDFDQLEAAADWNTGLVILFFGFLLLTSFT